MALVPTPLFRDAASQPLNVTIIIPVLRILAVPMLAPILRLFARMTVMRVPMMPVSMGLVLTLLFLIVAYPLWLAMTVMHARLTNATWELIPACRQSLLLIAVIQIRNVPPIVMPARRNLA